MREREGICNVRKCRARLLGAVGEVVDRVRDGTIGRRGCGKIGVLGCEEASEAVRRTSDDNVALAPLKVTEDGV